MKPQTQQKKIDNVFLYLATLPDAKQRRLLGLPPLPKPRPKKKEKKK